MELFALKAHAQILTGADTFLGVKTEELAYDGEM